MSGDEDVILLGENQRLSIVGLTSTQIETLTAVADEMRESQEETARLGEAYQRLLEELEAKNALLRQKDDLIEDLRRGEAEDVHQFKDKQGRAFRELQAKCDELAAELAAKDGELQEAQMDQTQMRQRITLLNLKVEELEENARRGGADTADVLRMQDSALRDIREKNQDMATTLAKRMAELNAVQAELADRTEELRQAELRAEASEREADRAVQDLAFLRTTITAEMEKQSQAIEEANAKAKTAMSELQSMKADNARLCAKFNASELAKEELELERSRLEDQVKRLREELDAARKVEGNLHIQLRKIEVVNKQRESTVAQLRAKLQEGQRGFDNERQQVEQLADVVQSATERLRKTNNHIEHLFTPSADDEGGEDHMNGMDRAEEEQGSVGRQRGGEEEDQEPAVLPVEVERVEDFAERLEALIQMHEWERKEQQAQFDVELQAREDAAARKEEALAAQLEEIRRRALLERDRRQELERMLEIQYDEECSRHQLSDNERGEWAVIASGANAARVYLYAQRLGACEVEEGQARLDIEDLEGAEWALLLSDADYDQEAAEEAASQRIEMMKAKHQVPKRRHTAYMGLEISEGITIKNTQQKVGKITKDGRAYQMEGVRVFQVAEGGPASLAGLQADDVVTHVNGTGVQSLADFKACARGIRPGETVTLTVWREGWDVTTRVDVHTAKVDEDEFAQGVRKKIGHRFTVVTRTEGLRKEREARRKDRQRQQKQRQLERQEQAAPQSSRGAAARSRSQSGTHTSPARSHSPTEGLRPTWQRYDDALGEVEHSTAATNTLAGAYSGPMTDRMFTSARSSGISPMYSDPTLATSGISATEIMKGMSDFKMDVIDREERERGDRRKSLEPKKTGPLWKL